MGRKARAIVFALGAVILLVVVLSAIGAFLIMIIWSWVVPDVFAGAVEQNVLPASISLWQALKLMIFFSVLGLTGLVASAKR